VPLRAGVIGLGVGMRHLATYESDARCEVVALCDIDEERLHETARTHPRCRATVDAMDVLNDPDIDIVSIASYDSDHGGHVVAAIRAGKHVFVEKPLCLHDEEFERIDAALRRHPEVQLSSNLLLRCAPRFVAAKTRIAAGAMGRVFYLEGDYNYGRLEKITDGWRGRLPFYSVTHGGAIHMIDLVLWLSGGRVREVVAAGNRIATTGSRFRHDDMVTALLRFEDGATAKVSANFGCVCPHSHAVAVYGTGGSFFASLQGTVFYGSRDPKVPPEAVDAAEDVEFRDGVQRAFIRQILEGVPGVVVARDVLDAMAVSLAVERSLTSGRWEPVRYVMAGASTAAGAAADYQ
jgi:predicted dehydrogenase